MKKKFICTVCGYVYEGTEPPANCPQCKVPASKFKELEETSGALQFVQEHVIGIANEYGIALLTLSLLWCHAGRRAFCRNQGRICIPSW